MPDGSLEGEVVGSAVVGDIDGDLEGGVIGCGKRGFMLAWVSTQQMKDTVPDSGTI